MKPRLHVVTPTKPGPREKAVQRLRKIAKPATLLECNRCAGREVIETRVGMEMVDGKARGGTKQYLCALCHMKGERVVLA